MTIANAAEVKRNARVVAAAGGILGAVTTALVPGVAFNPNRIVEGRVMTLFGALGTWGWVVLGLWCAAALFALSRVPERARGLVVTLLGGLAPAVTLWRVGVAAATFAAGSEVARTGLHVGFWIALFASYVVIFAGTAWIESGLARGLLAYAPVAAAALLVVMGSLRDLGIAREYANDAQGFVDELRLHATYVLGSVAFGLASGVLLGVVTARRRRLEPPVFGVLNVLQVLPTLAFVGLLYPVLSSLSDSVPVLERLGVRGVGWAPVIIVLAAYAVYPIARNTHAALVSLDANVLDAARGMGMGRMRTLVEVELPLALPVVIAGLRTASVQTTAGAVVAGLVGGGGLGTYVFLGASETATDLILLGVLPIVALAVTFDRLAFGLQRVLQPWGVDR